MLSQSELEEFRHAFLDEMDKKNCEKYNRPRRSDAATFDYELSAIVTHLGGVSTQTGHYVADTYR